MDPKTQQEVREELKRRGFDSVGFAKPPLGEAGERFAEWLRRGHHGTMAYLDRRGAERLSPDRLLPEFRSAIVLAHGYDSGLPNSTDPAEANVSRYAWGEDYHEVLSAKLRDFEGWLVRKIPEARCYAGVDAAPILEKAWAERSGLGWIGKHTNLIEAESGSYFFLAVLLTNLDFAEDAPVADRCGVCTRCIEICPTRAIVGPYQLDARLCISYLTIELKGPIPRELRPLIGNHVFGCDDCQEVCPWNRFSRPTREGRFFPRDGVRAQPLESFLELSEAEFKRRFAGSAVLRAKRRGFLRNVCVAIGNSGRAELAEKLLPLLEDAEPLVRGHAVWAYGRLLGEAALARLRELKEKEEDGFVREEIAYVHFSK
ncbi:MAG TPA: tRNA epoxyqueuosine(34) reductase QueG [bacterium]|nr:tRNA epoxyqueuosine(34) reductase QueG [bacterium]